ncbi:MAG: hypothetical protein Q4F06_05070 [Eubacteriales bacterium]|nr:hypothetical protein [Eubacteriales bacterium]
MKNLIILRGNSGSGKTTAVKLYGEHIYAYYFDIPFEETVRRHQTRAKSGEFGEEAYENIKRSLLAELILK